MNIDKMTQNEQTLETCCVCIFYRKLNKRSLEPPNQFFILPQKKKHILGVFLHTIFLEGKLNDFYDLLIIKKNFSLYVFCIPLCTASCNASVVVWLMIEWEALAQETVLETSVQKTVIGNTGTFSM